MKAPLTPRKTRSEIMIFIMDHSKMLTNGCIVFLGSRSGGNGASDDLYGYISYKGKKESVHRVIWQIKKGPIPEGMNVLHTCDNPPCWNIGHLWLGTHKENTQDMIAKGRHPMMCQEITEEPITKLHRRF